MDELEAVGANRAHQQGGQCDAEKNSALTVLLRKVEEFGTGYLLAATNLPDGIDPALWRRFNMQIPIGLPGADERFAILRRYGLPFAFTDDDLDILTSLTDGAAPSLLRELMEGIKRALIVRPRMRLSIDDPMEVFASVLASTMPPPEMAVPKLWSSRDALEQLRGMAWPPTQEKSA